MIRLYAYLLLAGCWLVIALSAIPYAIGRAFWAIGWVFGRAAVFVTTFADPIEREMRRLVEETQ